MRASGAETSYFLQLCGKIPKKRPISRTRGNKNPRRLMGEHLQYCRAGIYPPALFSPSPVHLIPPGEGGRGRRGNNDITTTQRRDGVAQRPRATIASRELRLIRSVIPLSLTISPPKGDKREGDIPLIYQ